MNTTRETPFTEAIASLYRLIGDMRPASLRTQAFEYVARVAAELERHEHIVRAWDTGELRMQALQAEIARLRDGLRRIAEKQTETLEVLRANGIVFDNLHDHWQKVAFTIYTDLCEIDTWAHELLDEDVSGRALLSASQ